MKSLHTVTFILVVVGALNWGLVGLSGLLGGGDWNLVKLLVGSWPVVENLVYLLVGLSAVGLAISHKKDCRHCNASGMM